MRVKTRLTEALVENWKMHDAINGHAVDMEAVPSKDSAGASFMIRVVLDGKPVAKLFYSRYAVDQYVRTLPAGNYSWGDRRG